MEIEGADGSTVATVKKAMITPLRDRFIDRCRRGRASCRPRATSSTTSSRSRRDGTKVAEVSKKWFRVRDTYGVEVAAGQNDALILAITVCIDQMAAG